MKDISVNLLALIPVIILTTIINVILCSIVSQTLMIHLLMSGVDKYVALIIAVIVAALTYTYIIYYHKIRNLFLDKRDIKNE